MDTLSSSEISALTDAQVLGGSEPHMALESSPIFFKPATCCLSSRKMLTSRSPSSNLGSWKMCLRFTVYGFHAKLETVTHKLYLKVSFWFAKISFQGFERLG